MTCCTCGSNESNPVPVTITADTSVKTSSLAVQYSRFYPKNDGYRDTDKISGKTLEPATVTIRIYTSGGTRIKTFSLGTKNGTYSATWTGRRKRWLAVPAGHVHGQAVVQGRPWQHEDRQPVDHAVVQEALLVHDLADPLRGHRRLRL